MAWVCWDRRTVFPDPVPELVCNFQWFAAAHNTEERTTLEIPRRMSLVCTNNGVQKDDCGLTFSTCSTLRNRCKMDTKRQRSFHLFWSFIVFCRFPDLLFDRNTFAFFLFLSRQICFSKCGQKTKDKVGTHFSNPTQMVRIDCWCEHTLNSWKPAVHLSDTAFRTQVSSKAAQIALGNIGALFAQQHATKAKPCLLQIVVTEIIFHWFAFILLSQNDTGDLCGLPGD